MSIERRSKKRWRVRWLQDGKHRARTFDSYREAHQFELQVKSLKLEGRMRSAPRLTLAAFAEEKWFPERVSQLAEATQRFYRAAWDKHIAPGRLPADDGATAGAPRPDSLGARRIRDISVATVRQFERQLLASTGPAMTRKTLMVLSSCMSYAVAEDYLSANPLMFLRTPGRRAGPRPKGTRPPRALPPLAVERLRARLLRNGAAGQRDALLVSLMAYGGLRPGEALALRTSSVRERTILVERAISFGKEKGTKTGGVRHPRALGALPREVADWRAKARLGPDDLLVSRDDGTPWREYDYRNWRRRVFKPAAEAADLGSVNPYSLRHSWASLLLRSPEFHADPARIARMAGHSLQTFFRYYAHEIEEFAGQPVLEPEAVIANARAEVSEQLRLL